MYNFWLRLNCAVYNYSLQHVLTQWHWCQLFRHYKAFNLIHYMCLHTHFNSQSDYMYCIKVACIMILNASPYKQKSNNMLSAAMINFQTIATNVNVGRWSEKSQNPGRKLHPTKIMYLFLNLFTSNQYTFPYII